MAPKTFAEIEATIIQVHTLQNDILARVSPLHRPAARTFEELNRRVTTASQNQYDELIKNSPFTIPMQTPFAADAKGHKELERMQRQMMDIHKNVGILPCSFTIRKNALPHVDKTRKALSYASIYISGWVDQAAIQRIVAQFATDTTVHSMQTDVMELVTECQRSTCEVMFVAMHRLYHLLGGKGTFDKSSLPQRRELYRQIYIRMSLAIDLQLYRHEKHTVDFATINANFDDDTAEKFRALGEYKFIRLAEATMYFRVWKFWNWKEPVYAVWKTMRHDDAMAAIGITNDPGEVPGVHIGARGVNARKMVKHTGAGSYVPMSKKRKSPWDAQK